MLFIYWFIFCKYKLFGVIVMWYGLFVINSRLCLCIYDRCRGNCLYWWFNFGWFELWLCGIVKGVNILIWMVWFLNGFKFIIKCYVCILMIIYFCRFVFWSIIFFVLCSENCNVKFIIFLLYVILVKLN